MEFFKTFLLGRGALVFGLGAVSFFLPGPDRVERVAVIQAKPEKVILG